MPRSPSIPAKDVVGNTQALTNLMRRLIAVPHAEIKTKLDADRREANVYARFPRPCLFFDGTLQRLRFSHLAGQFCISQSVR